jgi:hypothetical protein
MRLRVHAIIALEELPGEGQQLAVTRVIERLDAGNTLP